MIVIVSMVSGSRAPIAWKSALCSESIGSSSAPARLAACITAAPAHTRVSLLASATVRPAATAAKVGSRPAAPTIAETTRSTSRSAASRTASVPAAASTRGTGEPRLEVAVAGRIGDRGEFGAELERAPRERRAVAPAGHRGDREPARRRADHLRARAPDRSGRPEYREPPGPASRRTRRADGAGSTRMAAALLTIERARWR